MGYFYAFSCVNHPQFSLEIFVYIMPPFFAELTGYNQHSEVIYTYKNEGERPKEEHHHEEHLQNIQSPGREHPDRTGFKESPHCNLPELQQLRHQPHTVHEPSGRDDQQEGAERLHLGQRDLNHTTTAARSGWKPSVSAIASFSSRNSSFGFVMSFISTGR